MIISLIMYSIRKSFKLCIIHDQRNDHLRDLLEFKAQQPIHISEVESAETIVKRFNTGAMHLITHYRLLGFHSV
jgi:glutamate synthase domain-containing protein 2